MLILLTDIAQSLNEKLAEIEGSNFNKDFLNNYLRNYSKKNAIPFPELMKTLRALLSGLKVYKKYLILHLIQKLNSHFI